jgi:hypothetical protein
LKPSIETLAREARRIYDTGAERIVSKINGMMPQTAASGNANSVIRASKFDCKTGEALNGQGRRSAKILGDAIDSAARIIKETKSLEKIKASLKSQNPQIANELGW